MCISHTPHPTPIHTHTQSPPPPTYTHAHCHTHTHTTPLPPTLAQSHRHAAHLDNEVNKLCKVIKEGQSSGDISYKAANKMITDMGDVRD